MILPMITKKGAEKMKGINSLTKRLIAAIAAGTILITMPMSGCNLFNGNNESSNTKEGSSQNGKTGSDGDTETDAANSYAMTSEHYKIPFAVFEYFYNYNYKSFTNSYGSTIIDSSKDLSEQYYDNDNKISWKDYFISTTKEYLSQVIIFAEAALDAGVSLSDDDKKTLDESYKQMEEVAKKDNKTIDEYFLELYGPNIKKEDIRSIQEMSTLGIKYRNQLSEGYVITDEDYEKEFNSNKTSYQVADYYSYTFNYAKSSDDGASSTVDEDAKKKMKEYADGLSNCKDGKEFNDYLTKFLKANPSNVYIHTSEDEESVTEEKFNTALNTTVEYCAHKKSAYDDSTDTGKWIFDASRKQGDSKVTDTTTGYEVVLVDKPLYRDETATRAVRHILITADSVVSAGKATDASSVTDDQVKEYALEIYNDWKSKDTTEERFAELANQYSKDTGSNTKGGIYENVTEGQMVPAFNDWLFDKGRKQGDSGIVKTDYGYHIMYYVGSGLKGWQIKMDSKIRDDRLSADFETFKNKHKIDYNDSVINKVELEKTEESSGESSAANLANQ